MTDYIAEDSSYIPGVVASNEAPLLAKWGIAALGVDRKQASSRRHGQTLSVNRDPHQRPRLSTGVQCTVLVSVQERYHSRVRPLRGRHSMPLLRC